MRGSIGSPQTAVRRLTALPVSLASRDAKQVTIFRENFVKARRSGPAAGPAWEARPAPGALSGARSAEAVPQVWPRASAAGEHTWQVPSTQQGPDTADICGLEVPVSFEVMVLSHILHRKVSYWGQL